MSKPEDCRCDFHWSRGGHLHTAPWPLGKVSVGIGTCPIIKQNDACEERARPLENTLNKSDSRCLLGSVPHGGRHIRNLELPKCAYWSTVLELEIKGLDFCC